jgi:small subunit ribosomal protein S16
MAVKLRLRREGTVKCPTYRVVAADSRSPRNGRFIEIFGEYRPLEDPSYVRIDEQRALHWLNHGAQPTDAVKHLLRITGVWEQFKPDDVPTRQRTQDKVKLSKKARAKAAESESASDTPAEASADEGGDA